MHNSLPAAEVNLKLMVKHFLSLANCLLNVEVKLTKTFEFVKAFAVIWIECYGR